jgi:hypothetical protein
MTEILSPLQISVELPCIMKVFFINDSPVNPSSPLESTSLVVFLPEALPEKDFFSSMIFAKAYTSSTPGRTLAPVSSYLVENNLYRKPFLKCYLLK